MVERLLKFSGALGLVVGLLSGCSTAKKSTRPELSEMESKKVALVSVDGEATAKKVIEVALVNQLVQRGTFILVGKPEVEAARALPQQDPTDWRSLAKRVGADYALRVQVLQFDAPTHEGYSTEEVIDTQLAEEQGTDGKTERVYKVKSLEGTVRVELQFTRLKDGDTRTGVAEEQGRVQASAKSSSIHLPPQLRYLEDLANKAFRKFFDQYN